MRVAILFLLLSALALAAKPKLKDVFDPQSVSLGTYVWPEWRKLSKKERLATRGIDPDGWETPPPDKLTPEEVEKKKKRDEEEAKKSPEQREKERQKRLNAPGPRDRYAGFRYSQRLKRKQGMFNRMVDGLPPSSIEGLIKKLTQIDKLGRKFDKVIGETTESFLKSKEQLDRTRQQQIDRHMKKHGKPPDRVMVSRSLLQAYERDRRSLQLMLSVQESERQFHKWVMRRFAEMIEALPEADRGKPYAALAAGLKGKDWRQRLRCAAILGYLHDERAHAIFDAALAAEADPYMLAELIRIRARRRPAGIFELLAERLKDKRWQVRAAVVAELGRIPKKESIDLLIARLNKEDGRLKDDIADALEALTLKEFEADAAPWEAWWKKSKPTWKPPEKKTMAGGEVAAKEGGEGKSVAFYGIRTHAKRIVFCLDVSGSMGLPLDGEGGKKKPRIETARQEMLRALRLLPEDAVFTIVAYHSTVAVWKKKLAKATPAHKKSATRWIEKLQPAASTNIYDALEKSLQLATGAVGKRDDQAVTIFFMTDGVPTDGRVVDPAQILSEITERNRRLGVVIHTVGVSKDQNGAFLLNLARANGGRYAARK